ncbi:YegS/Rv2252/BmrU family lipid kinase [Sphingomonas sediminicola]|uniref:YegS/Rv2252/BmrU family lipid kinase n=1 Tax=Sphingomonas sediminicola TaxID=386874 RepID=A0ABX6TC27_9SPHN|nr:YegS/Rv2252/BmrU family lipid kinase [Sphingomonas sediminicola]QNP46298.1 YegS/Rv2252/BmrU family lipid kinase [Sphingomonas sediminicola]
MGKSLPKQAILVVNAGSRKGADLFAEARDKLIAAGIELLAAKKCKTAKSMETEVKQALEKAPMVIVGGGDGSLSSFVDYFIGTDVVFALLPLGTANSFARTMGVPLDLDGAVDVIAKGEAREIDVGCINGDYFLNAAAMGLAPKVAESVPHGLKRTLGRLGYLIWAGWSAANFRAFRVKLEDGKRTVRMWATEVRIANGRFHGGIELIENADLKSGEIVVQVVTGRSVAKLGWSYFASAVKLKARHQTVREFVASEFTLSTKPRMKVSIDGEVGAETPLKISALPDGVTIAAPRD